ncbi:MAG: hypothetical protein KGQ26_00410 [Rhodospirillales bacterium]|nr:hypothetical protein [Rhodospirillales bacterium]
MKSKFEFQLNRLDAFRFALSRIARRRLRSGGRVHGLALQVGAWPGEKYAPLPQSWVPVVSPGHARASAPSPLRGLEQGKNRATRTPAFLRQITPSEKTSYTAGLLRKANIYLKAGGFVSREKINHSDSKADRTRLRTVLVKEGRSFAPPPVTERPTKLGVVKMPAQASEKKISGSSEANETVLPLTEGFELKAESRTKQRELMAPRAYEYRPDAELIASSNGRALNTDFGDAIEEYFFRQSRLAPSGGAAFDPRQSPLWAGLKLPG